MRYWPSSRCRVVNTGLAITEITTKLRSITSIFVRNKIAEIGYTDAVNGFCSNSCSVLLALDEQSPDIAR